MQGNKNGAVRGTNGSNSTSPEAGTMETTLAGAKALGATVDEEAAPLNGEKGKADVVVVTSKGANNGGTSTKVCPYVI